MGAFVVMNPTFPLYPHAFPQLKGEKCLIFVETPWRNPQSPQSFPHKA
jgi:hypothetical protein